MSHGALGRKFRRAVVAALLVGASGCAALPPSDAPQPGSGVVDLALPGGGVQRLLYVQPEHPAAVVVPLVGGDGMVMIDGAGQASADSFLITRRDDWLAQGLAVAYPRQAEPFWAVARYAEILTAIVGYIRTRTDAPIWVVAHSNGAVSAVKAATLMTHGEIAGIVLMSSKSRIHAHNTGTVFSWGLGRVTVPALIVAHVDDTCADTPPTDAAVIRDGLIHTPKAEVMMIEGGSAPANDQCVAAGQHSFAGIQPQVIARVAAWIKAQPRS